MLHISAHQTQAQNKPVPAVRKDSIYSSDAASAGYLQGKNNES